MTNAAETASISTVLRRIYQRCSPVLLAAAIFSTIAAPMAAAWLFPIFGIAAVIAFPDGHRPVIKLLGAGLVLLAFRLFALDLFASVLWSASRRDSLEAAVLFSVYLSCVWLISEGLRSENASLVDRLSRAIVAGVIAGTLFILVEIATGSSVEKWVFTYLPFTRPAISSHVGMSNGKVIFLAPDELNRGIAMLNLFAWPALALAFVSRAANAKSAAVVIAAFVCVTTFVSRHETSKLAIALSLAIFLLYGRWPKAARVLVVIGWVTSTLLIAPLAAVAYRADLHLASWIPENGRARIILWAATVEKIPEHPLLGIGANATALLDERDGDAEIRPGHVYRWRTGMHAHDIYLQTWYELGATGALLLLAIGLALLRWIFALPGPTQRFTLATFVTAAVIGAFGFGMWQAWLVAGYFFTAMIVLVAVKQISNLSGRWSSSDFN